MDVKAPRSEEEYTFLMPSDVAESEGRGDAGGSDSDSQSVETITDDAGGSDSDSQSIETITDDDDDSYSIVSSSNISASYDTNDGNEYSDDDGSVQNSQISTQSNEDKSLSTASLQSICVPDNLNSAISPVSDTTMGDISQSENFYNSRAFARFDVLDNSVDTTEHGDDYRDDTAQDILSNLFSTSSDAFNRLIAAVLYWASSVNDLINRFVFKIRGLNWHGAPAVIIYGQCDSSLLDQVEAKLTKAYNCAPSMLLSPIGSRLIEWLEALGYLPRFLTWKPNFHLPENSEQTSRLFSFRVNKHACPDVIICFYESGEDRITRNRLDDMRAIAADKKCSVLFLDKSSRHDNQTYSISRSTDSLDDFNEGVNVLDFLNMEDDAVYRMLSTSPYVRSDCAAVTEFLNWLYARSSTVLTETKRHIISRPWNTLLVCGVFLVAVAGGLSSHFEARMESTCVQLEPISPTSLLISAPLRPTNSYWNMFGNSAPSGFQIDEISRVPQGTKLLATVTQVRRPDIVLVSLHSDDAWGDINITLSLVSSSKQLATRWYLVHLSDEQEGLGRSVIRTLRKMKELSEETAGATLSRTTDYLGPCVNWLLTRAEEDSSKVLRHGKHNFVSIKSRVLSLAWSAKQFFAQPTWKAFGMTKVYSLKTQTGLTSLFRDGYERYMHSSKSKRALLWKEVSSFGNTLRKKNWLRSKEVKTNPLLLRAASARDVLIVGGKKAMETANKFRVGFMSAVEEANEKSRNGKVRAGKNAAKIHGKYSKKGRRR